MTRHYTHTEPEVFNIPHFSPYNNLQVSDKDYIVVVVMLFIINVMIMVSMTFLTITLDNVDAHDIMLIM